MLARCWRENEMSANEKDMSKDLGMRLTFSEYEANRAQVEVYNRATNQGVLVYTGRSYAEAYQLADFAIRGVDRRANKRIKSDRRKISLGCIIPSVEK